MKIKFRKSIHIIVVFYLFNNLLEIKSTSLGIRLCIKWGLGRLFDVSYVDDFILVIGWMLYIIR
jgi:hypothetical protein